VLRASEQPAEVYDQALSLLAAVIYWRPDLIGPDTASALEALIAGPPLPDILYRSAAEALNFLLTTPAASCALALLLALLAVADRPPAAYDALLGSLEYAAFWAVSRLDLAVIISLTEQEHLAGQRARLLHRTIERLLFACPTRVTAPLLERLHRLYQGHPSFKYVLSYLSGRPSVKAEVRNAAAAAAAPQFPLRRLVAPRLRRGKARVLVVQNISDGQGDEIVRVVPLLESLLGGNPLLEVVLITKREYLYGHSRLRVVPIEDRAATRTVLGETFDAVVDFFEPAVPDVNYDVALEVRVRAHARSRAPFLSLASSKRWNRFLFERFDVESRSYAAAIGLDRQRVENVYETTCRLIAELGLPLRFGEEPPPADSVLAGLPCPDAETAWSKLVEQNHQRRPVALVCPFGGIEPLKGYVDRRAEPLSEQLRGLIAEGFYVVLLPNGTPWGAAAQARRVVSLLDPSEQSQVVVAPDPTGWTEPVTYQHAGTHTVPRASYQMRLATYFVRFAALVVTVEGWMVHAAYCLGKRYRVLMLPYSHPTEWHPYGRTVQQDVVLGPAHVPPEEEGVAPPLPEQPRKFVLLYLLRSLGRSGEAHAVPLLQWALRSEDRDVRQSAAESLSRFSGPVVDADLIALLHDPAYRVRAAAAGALLSRFDAASPRPHGIPREQLLAQRWIGEEPRDWDRVLSLGEQARQAPQTAILDDDPVIRREAAAILDIMDRQRVPVAAVSPVSGMTKALRRLFRSG